MARHHEHRLMFSLVMLLVHASYSCSIEHESFASLWSWQASITSSSPSSSNLMRRSAFIMVNVSVALDSQDLSNLNTTNTATLCVARVHVRDEEKNTPFSSLRFDVGGAHQTIMNASVWTIEIHPPAGVTIHLIGGGRATSSAKESLRRVTVAPGSRLLWPALDIPVAHLDASGCTLVADEDDFVPTSLPSRVTTLFLDDVRLASSAIENSTSFLVNSLLSVYSSLVVLSARRSNLTGNPFTFVKHFERLEVFDGNHNLWSFGGASAFLTTVEGATPFPLTLKVFRAARMRIDNGAVVVGAESALVLSATCNRSVVAASQYQPQIVVDISGHSFSSIIFNASNDPLCDSDEVSTDKTTLAVLGIASLDASSLTSSPSNGALQILAIGFMGTATLSFDKSYFIDYFRLSTSAFFTNTPLSFGNSALSVETESPSWLCGSSFVCRNMSLRSCGIHVSLLNLSNLGSEWLALDLRGSNDFEKVTQPSGLQSTEPVLLGAESCDVTNPCYEGGYARCVCSGSSSSSSDSEPSSPSPPSSPIWERRDVWIAVSAVLAFIMLFVGIMYLCKGWCVGDGRHSSYMSIDQRDMRGAEELNERDAYGGGSHTQWSQEDEAAILCDAQECLFMFDQYIIYPHALGDGTTAKVFKVTRKADRQTLAMKRYSFKATNNDDDFADFAAFEWMELFKEFWLLRHIDHPNVIRIEEVFISFYDALAAHSGNSDTAVLGSFSSNPLSSSSSVTIQSSGKQRFSDTHYPPESLTDNLTPFLLAVDKVRSHVVPNRALEQQNRSRRYCYIFMSYIPDGTLVTFLNQRRGEEARSASNRAVVDNRAVLCEEEALALALQLFQALEYLHDPHRRRHLWAIANGGGNSMSEVTETSSRFFSKPNALSSLSHSDNHMFSSASFAKSLREGGAAGPAAASRGTSQLLMEDGPILHRDVKPDNLLIHRLPGYHVGPFTQRRYPNARLVLTDFGFADFYRQGVHVSHKGAPPAYAAPEVVRGRPSPACDVFSAGVVLFEMLSTSKVDQRHHGHFSTGVSRPSYVEKQKGLLFSLGIREETISFLFRRILVYDPAERCSAAQAVQELRLLLAPPLTS